MQNPWFYFSNFLLLERLHFEQAQQWKTKFFSDDVIVEKTKLNFEWKESDMGQ